MNSNQRIRLEGFLVNNNTIGSHIGINIDVQHILAVLDIYEDVLPCVAIENPNQYYVIFNPSAGSHPIITTLELSPDLKKLLQ
jgi:hypothetical protein